MLGEALREVGMLVGKTGQARDLVAQASERRDRACPLAASRPRAAAARACRGSAPASGSRTSAVAVGARRVEAELGQGRAQREAAGSVAGYRLDQRVGVELGAVGEQVAALGGDALVGDRVHRVVEAPVDRREILGKQQRVGGRGGRGGRRQRGHGRSSVSVVLIASATSARR
jgi:hypothetical protein